MEKVMFSTRFCRICNSAAMRSEFVIRITSTSINLYSTILYHQHKMVQNYRDSPPDEQLSQLALDYYEYSLSFV